MKTKILAILIILVASSAAAYAVDADFYAEVEPKKLELGEKALLNITLKNLGVTYATYLKAILDPNDISPIDAVGTSKKYLSTAEAAEESQRYFGLVRQKQELNLQYEVYVSRDSEKGQYNVPLQLIWLDALSKVKNQTLDMYIEVYGEPELRIAGITTTPAHLYPDTDFNLSINLENIGTEDAKSIEVSLTLPEGITGKSKAYSGTVAKDSTSTLNFGLTVEKDAPMKVYDFGVSIIYEDEHGNDYSHERDFEVYVHELEGVNLEISGLTKSPSKIYPGTDFTLTVQLENNGEQDAKSVKVEISPPAEFSGEFLSYVGKIESDDVSSGIFDLKVSELATPGNYEFPLLITCTDEGGKTMTKEKSFEVFVDQKADNTGLKQAGAGILVLIVLAYLWRRRGSGAE